MSQESIGVVNRVLQKHFKNSVIYNEEQKPFVRELTMKDVITRILSFLLDSIFMFWPSMIFIISILLLASPANIGESLVISTWELTVIYIVSILSFNTISAIYWVGQTIGLRYYDLKIVKKDHSELTISNVIIRELIGVSLPWACILLSYCMISFSAFIALFVLFLLGNLVFIIVDKKHRSPIDVLLGTTIIKLSDMHQIKEFDEEVIKEEIEEGKDDANLPKEEAALTEEKVDVETKEEKEEALETEEPSLEPLEEESIEVTKDIILEEEPVIEEKEVDSEETMTEPVVEEHEEEIEKQSKAKSKKEKSVTEIISEAVTVVDQALENKKEIYPVKIEKTKKKETTTTKNKTVKVENEENNQKDQVIEDKKDIVMEQRKEEKIEQEPITSKSSHKTEPSKDKKVPKKNQKKKTGKNTKAPAKKATVKVKDIKPIASVKKTTKKSN